MTPTALSRSHSLAVLAPVLAAFLAGPIPAQPAEADRFQEDIAVTVVEIPVQVLRNGKPVRGLTAADFEVLDRGQPQEITDFEIIDLTIVDETSAAPSGARREPPASVDSGASPPGFAGPSRGRHFLLLFDLDFSAVGEQFKMLRALRGAERMIQTQLHPRDRAAIAIYTRNSGARIVVGFTDDREEAQAGLSFVDALLDRDQKRLAELAESLGDRQEAGGLAGIPIARLVRQFGSSAALVISAGDLGTASLQAYDDLVGAGGGQGPGSEGGSDGLVEYLSDSTDVALEPGLSRIEDLSDAVEKLTTLLRSIPEPKHLVFFSVGFPNVLIDTSEIRARAQNRLQPLVNALRATGWRVQAVDISGVPDPLAASGRSAEAESDPAADLFVAGSDRFGPTPTGVGFEAQTLFQMAHDTGGELFDNYNDFGKATAALVERSAVTYLLVVQPPGIAADGSYHPLDVRLVGGAPGARVLHRPGYYAPKPAAERNALERRLDEADLILGGREIATLDAAAMVYPLPPTAARPELPLLIEIAGPALLEAGDGASRLEIQAYVLSADGTVVDVVSQRLQLDLQRLGPRLREGPLRFLGSLEAPVGDSRVRVRVQDFASGRQLLTTLPLSLRVPGDAPVVLQPLLLRPRDQTRPTLRAPALGAGIAEAFSFGEVTVQPDLRPILRPGEARYVLLTLFPTAGRLPAVEYRVLAADGSAEAGVELEWAERADRGAESGVQLIGILRVAGLAAGDYSLEVTLRDPAGGLGSVASSPFRVLR